MDITQVITEVMQYTHPELSNVFFLNKELYRETELTRKHRTEKGRKVLWKFFDDEGKCREWYPNGQLRVRYNYVKCGFTIGGYYHGLYQRWHKNGTLAAEGIFHHGNLCSITLWDESRTITMSKTFHTYDVPSMYYSMLYGEW